MNDFENYLIGYGLFLSRFIASWTKIHTRMKKPVYFDDEYFGAWLRSLVIDGRHLTDKEVRDIIFMAENGKMELEDHAQLFVKKYEETQ